MIIEVEHCLTLPFATVRTVRLFMFIASVPLVMETKAVNYRTQRAHSQAGAVFNAYLSTHDHQTDQRIAVHVCKAGYLINHI